MADSRGKDSSFLRKMVKFVSNPNTEWGDIPDSAAAEPNQGASADSDRSELQVMIERKRRNDFVRRQELDLLRQIRREGLTGDQIREMQREQGFEHSGYQPTEQGALPASEVRRRIDGIEREMSYEDTVVNTRSLPLTQPLQRPADRPSTVSLRETTPLGSGADPTQAGALRRLGSQVTLPKVDLQFDTVPNPAELAGRRPPGGPEVSARPQPRTREAESAESARWHPVLEMGSGDVSGHDPELDPAALAFANADFSGCEKMLRALVTRGGDRERHVPTWRALLDLYRAIGQQQRFEWTAAHYVKDLGEAAPSWVSIPRLAMNMAPPPDVLQSAASPVVRKDTSANDTGQAQAWLCPARLDAAAVARLRVHVLGCPEVATVDWGSLQMLDAEGAQALRTLFREWASEPRSLHWQGVEALFDLLEIAAPPGDHLVDPGFWQVRLEALRLLGSRAPYDLAAEDFAATYGAMPPEWTPAATKVSTQDDGLTDLASRAPDFAVSTLPDELGLTSTITVELVGQLAGDVSQTMVRALSEIGDATTVMVSCERLIRVDLMAAGELLNWVAARRSEGRLVRFTQVHRLVALFFCAMGLDDQAPIELRPL